MDTREFDQAEGWLRRAVRAAPHPMLPGAFARILDAAQSAGIDRAMGLDVLDAWLSYGYCRIIDPVSNDIEVTPLGEGILTPAPPPGEPADESDFGW